MEKSIIIFSDVTDGDLYKVCFLDDLKEKHIYIIYEFIKNDVKDYIVIGKLLKEYIGDRKIRYIDWVALTNRLIKNQNLKDDKRTILRNFEYHKFLDHDVTKTILFTKEGYDLITNKFLYTNSEIERTVDFNVIYSNDGEIRYDVKPFLDKYLQKEDIFFKPIEELENNYFLSDSQLKSMSEDNFLRYIKDNQGKLIRLLKANRRYREEFEKLKTDAERINYLMQIMSIMERQYEMDKGEKSYR